MVFGLRSLNLVYVCVETTFPAGAEIFQWSHEFRREFRVEVVRVVRQRVIALPDPVAYLGPPFSTS